MLNRWRTPRPTDSPRSAGGERSQNTASARRDAPDEEQQIRETGAGGGFTTQQVFGDGRYGKHAHVRTRVEYEAVEMDKPEVPAFRPGWRDSKFEV